MRIITLLKDGTRKRILIRPRQKNYSKVTTPFAGNKHAIFFNGKRNPKLCNALLSWKVVIFPLSGFYFGFTKWINCLRLYKTSAGVCHCR